MMEFKNKFVESAKEELEAVKVKQEKVKRRLQEEADKDIYNVEF